MDQAAKINQELIHPLAKSGDDNPCIYENGIVRSPPGYKEAYKKFISDGWTSLSCDPEYGGQGMPKTVSTFLKKCYPQLVCHLNFTVNLALAHIIAYFIMQTNKLKIKFLPKIVEESGVAQCV